MKEVKRLNGNFTFKDANDWQKGYYTKENDVEKEADTNSPWVDNLRASIGCTKVNPRLSGGEKRALADNKEIEKTPQ